MTIVFTKHAENKFAVLRRHKFVVKRHQVLRAVTDPERIDYSRTLLIVAQRSFDSRRVLRVVYKQEGEVVKIITFYPGRKSQYEKRS